MKKTNKKTKKGAASFYVVAFSTLVLMIIATSFAAIIISEVTRTSNDDLAQSAYDSAMAGVEDAKLAYYNYQNCLIQKQNGSSEEAMNKYGCNEIFHYFESKTDDCDMVAKIIGRDSGSVVIDESKNVGNNMQQAYTCVTMTDSLNGYESTLSQSDLIRVIKAKFDDDIGADKIGKVRLSWFSDSDSVGNKVYSNYDSLSSSVIFPDTISAAVSTPPTLSLAMVQTANDFNMNEFDTSVGSRTNRAMVYLVPTQNGSAGKTGNHISATGNNITKAQFAKSNDKKPTNLPFTVDCNEGTADYACSATIELPEPVGAEAPDGHVIRNDDTFIFVVGLPYGKPQTSFLLEFLCKDGTTCKSCSASDPDCTEISSGSSVNLKGVQLEVDSTGRANDLYRRISVRMDNRQDYSLSLLGPLELLNDGSNESLVKDYTVLQEYNFFP